MQMLLFLMFVGCRSSKQTARRSRQWPSVPVRWNTEQAVDDLGARRSSAPERSAGQRPSARQRREARRRDHRTYERRRTE